MNKTFYFREDVLEKHGLTVLLLKNLNNRPYKVLGQIKANIDGEKYLKITVQY